MLPNWPCTYMANKMSSFSGSWRLTESVMMTSCTCFGTKVNKASVEQCLRSLEITTLNNKTKKEKQKWNGCCRKNHNHADDSCQRKRLYNVLGWVVLVSAKKVIVSGQSLPLEYTTYSLWWYKYKSVPCHKTLPGTLWTMYIYSIVSSDFYIWSARSIQCKYPV